MTFELKLNLYNPRSNYNVTTSINKDSLDSYVVYIKKLNYLVLSNKLES